MVPLDDDFEHRGDTVQFGVICSSIRNAFPNEAKRCGIYEWMAVGTFEGQPDHVVYVGSTCRRKPGGLRHRILEYCTHGSHKKELINIALLHGYELWVRVKIVKGKHCSREETKRKAEKMENDLLNRYDYAWNIRNNGQMRFILPRP